MPEKESRIAELDERVNDTERLRLVPPDTLLDVLGEPAPRLIVNIEAGAMLYCGEFARRADEAVVYAIDSDPVTVNWLVEHRPPSAYERLYPILGEPTAVPVATGEADLVVMVDAHHELADPRATYRESFRILRGGGRILVADWAPSEGGEGPPGPARTSAEGIAEMLRDAGFDSVVSHSILEKHSLLTGAKLAMGDS